MIIEPKDVLTLDDDKEYVVIDKLLNGFLEYYYLVNKDNVSDYKFCYLDGEDMVEVLSENSKADLVVLFGVHAS